MAEGPSLIDCVIFATFKKLKKKKNLFDDSQEKPLPRENKTPKHYF
jgi:hypothetical protein